MLPHVRSLQASAMIDEMLAEYGYPSNSKNAARAGYEAARRLLAPALDRSCSLGANAKAFAAEAARSHFDEPSFKCRKSCGESYFDALDRE